jgi:hypothetical protein
LANYLQHHPIAFDLTGGSGGMAVGISESKTASAIQWDSSRNKIYFDVGKESLPGRLILRKTSNGKIDMQIIKGGGLTAR